MMHVLSMLWVTLELELRLATFVVNVFNFLVLRVIARELVADCLPVASNNCTYLFKMGMHATEAIFATAEWDLAVVDAATRVTNAYPVGNNSRGLSINCNTYVCISGRYNEFIMQAYLHHWVRNTIGCTCYRNGRFRLDCQCTHTDCMLEQVL